MKKNALKIFVPLLAALTITACASLPEVQGERPITARVEHAQPDMEASGFVSTANFLPKKWLKSKLHYVDPQAFNDGVANTYRIETADHTYFVQGTNKAKTRIHEIEVTELLKQRSTAITAAKSVGNKMINLVETPVRAVSGTKERFRKAKTVGDKFMVIPSGLGQIISNLGNGLKELGKTGLRIISSTASAQCSGLECAKQAGTDIFSGVNSVLGKHTQARRLHQSFSTDAYSDNKVYQREVDRLAYANSYSSAGLKLGVGWANIYILSPLMKGVGYYNNGEFLEQYEDASEYRIREEADLKDWGVDKKTSDEIYANHAYTPTTRTRLIQTMSKIGNAQYRGYLITQAASSKTTAIAESRLSVYEYIAKLDQSGMIKGFVAKSPSAIAITNNDKLIMPFAADYLKWTPAIKPVVEDLVSLAPNGKTEIHVLGKASSLFKANAAKYGARVVEVF